MPNSLESKVPAVTEYQRRMDAEWAERERSVFLNSSGAWEKTDLLGLVQSTALQRRAWRSDADLMVVLSAIWACVRRRSQAITKFSLVLKYKQSDGTLIDAPKDHPAMAALKRVNRGMTHRQGRALIEQQKLTTGHSVWVIRRDGLGTPFEFEVWPPLEVEVIPDEKEPWSPAYFVRQKPNGDKETVAAKDVVWLRHVIDPRDGFTGIGPIGAVRVEADTTMEAQRYNQRVYDNDTMLGKMFTAEDATPLQIQQWQETLDRKFKGTDKAHSVMITDGNLKLVESMISNKDMEFLESQKWTVEETARVFEMSPVLIGSQVSSTYNNNETVGVDFWEMMATQAQNEADEWTEFYLWPNFGEEWCFVVDDSKVNALQSDLKKQADIDAINLGSGKNIINELRKRDDEDPVPWGDTPIMSTTMAPLDTRTPEEKAATALAIAAARPAPQPPPGAPGAKVTPPVAGGKRSDPKVEIPVTPSGPTPGIHKWAKIEEGWNRRFGFELKAVLKHLDERAGPDAVRVNSPGLDLGDVDDYNWDWAAKYGPEVIDELTQLWSQVLADFEYDPAKLPTITLAKEHAASRAGNLLSLNGSDSLVATTKQRVRQLVEQNLASGDTLRNLKNQLRADFGFSASRAETIARTETATSLGEGKLRAMQSRGTSGKAWDVDGKPCPICIGNADAGIISIDDAFPSGHMTVPAHPRCECTIEPREYAPVAGASVDTQGESSGAWADIERDNVFVPLSQLENPQTDEMYALRSYVGISNGRINRALRTGDQMENNAEDIRLLDGLMHSRSTSRPYMVHRGVGTDVHGKTFIDDLKPGDTFTDKAYVSTTTKKEIISGFDSGGTMSIRVPQGTHAVTGNPYEEELILHRGQQFRVISKEGRHVDVEIVQ